MIIRKFFPRIILAAFFLLIGASVLYAQVDPWTMIKKIGKGINLGNTLDAPYEGNWAAAAQEFYFDDFKDAGFNNVRIPITWDNHMMTTEPYTIDSTWMDRVEQVVDWSLSKGFVTIINSHHDDWLFTNYPGSLERFKKLWEQVALRFKDKSDNLIFEIINEPYFDLSKSQVDSINTTILSIIRVNNPYRNVIITGGGPETSYSVVSNITLLNDPHLIATVHYYLPWNFNNNMIGTWGTANDKAVMTNNFNYVKSWSDNNNIPVYVGEFGVNVGSDRNSALEWTKHLVEECNSKGFAYSYWDSGPTSKRYIYYRQKNTWDEEVLNVVTGQTPFTGSPSKVPGTIEAENFDKGRRFVAYYNIDTVNTLGYYRPDEGIEIDSVGNGNYSVVFNNPDEWVEYTFEVDTSGTYKIEVNAAALDSSSKFRITFNAMKSTKSISVLPSGNMNNFLTAGDTLYLEAGVHVMRLVSETGVFAVDNIELSKINNGTDTENLLSNPGFEDGTLSWVPKSCTLTAVDTPVYKGNRALLVSQRTAAWSSPQQDIKSILIQKGAGSYKIGAFVRTVKDTGVTAKVTVKLKYGGQNKYFGTTQKVDAVNWTLVSGILELNWTGSLEEAYLYVETINNSTSDFYVDEVMFQLDTTATSIDLADRPNEIPHNYNLVNCPNPFNPSTTISFNLPSSGYIKLIIYNSLGREIKILFDNYLQSGMHKIVWNGDGSNGGRVASGIYFAKLQTNDRTIIRKLMLIK